MNGISIKALIYRGFNHWWSTTNKIKW